ncbi:MAG: transporter associated domain-containing protein [Lachnospiraceae bacterium]|nr:transporter associated domain-containing protein [Lachnospiraceae bacterium]
MMEETNSRFPVYEGDIDNIIGVLHFKDAMIFHNQKQYDEWLIKDIPNLLRPIKFIPETRSINLLFRSMQAQKLQMVIVVDEYGETAGLVTMEDILEEIVGNILDEYDEDERFILKEEDGSYRMDGMTPLEDVEETLDITFEEEDYETLNGYLIFRMDRIPEEDEHSVIEEKGYSFQILEVDNKTIKWVKVTRLPETEVKDKQESEQKADQEKEETVQKE